MRRYRMENYLNVLSETALFCDVADDDISSLLACLDAKIRRYKKSDYVLKQGERLDDIAILLDGSLHIQSDDYWGNRSILGHIGAGEIFGEAYALSQGGRMQSDVVAIEDCVVMFLDAMRIISTCSSACDFHSTVIRNMFYIIAKKNMQLVGKLGHVSKRTTREKLISYLSQEAKRQNSSEVVIPFNRQQLADFLFVDRSAMSNELCKMRDEGLLTFRKNTFKLL